jgi:hypothetical protein
MVTLMHPHTYFACTYTSAGKCGWVVVVLDLVFVSTSSLQQPRDSGLMRVAGRDCLLSCNEILLEKKLELALRRGCHRGV